MRIVLLALALCTSTTVCAKKKKTSIDPQQAKQLLNVALQNSLLNEDVRQKFTEEISKFALHGASNSLKKLNVTADCVKDMVEFLKGTFEAKPWALQMLDSFGKFPSGVSRGTVGALGDYDACLGVSVQKMYQKKTRFQGKYCLVHFSPPNEKNEQTYTNNSTFSKILRPHRHSRKLQPQTAICVPSTCTSDDVQNFLQLIAPRLQLDVQVKNCEAMNDKIKTTSLDKLFIFFLAILILVVIVSTILDLLKESEGTKAEDGVEKDSESFLHHFSLLRNARSLFKKENNPDSIRVFHGIRVLSTMWLILAHILTVMYDQAYGGLYVFFSLRKFLWSQIIPSSSMAVETFFFMSAVLLAYNMMKYKNSPITVSLAFQRRYVRTTIPLLFMIGCLCLLPLLTSGPLYKEIVGSEVENCKQRGWINFLYLQNLIPFQKMCMPSTWYLAADTQLFFLSLFVLVPYRKNPEKLVKLIVGLLFLGLFGKIVCIIVFNLPPTTLMLDPQFENASYVWQHSYFSPVFHLSTYSIGMLVGYMLASNVQINVSKITSITLWIASLLIQLSIVFGVYVWNSAEEPPGLTSSLLYGVSHRVLWSLTLAWITFSCQANDKNIISRFLGAEAFVPLSRLTYMAYLTNFTIKHIYMGTTRSLIIYNFWTMMTLVIAITTLTFLVSMVLTLIFESPFLSIEKSLLKRVIDKKKPKKETNEKTD